MKILLFTFLCCTIFTCDLLAQGASAIQFYDPTGKSRTAKFGWSGDSANGNFFITSPNGGNGLTITHGNVTVDGDLRANRFIGKIDSVDWSEVKNRPNTFVADSSITTAKIATKAITTTKLADSSVTISKINSATIGSSANQIAPGNHSHSVNFTNSGGDNGTETTVSRGDHIHDSRYHTKAQTDALIGGMDYNSFTMPVNTAKLITTAESVCAITISAPSAGFVIVWANAFISPNDDNYCALNCAISKSINSEESFFYTYHWPVNNKWVSGTLSLTDAFPVQQGSNTFYLNLWQAAGAPSVHRAKITALFVKNQL